MCPKCNERPKCKPFPNEYLYLSNCLIVSVLRWAQFAFKDLIDLFRRDIKDWQYITSLIGVGLADVTFLDALISERHSAGIKLILVILIR